MVGTPNTGGLNTRWLACEVALGRDDLAAWEFIGWINRQWVAFTAEHGCKSGRELELKLGGRMHSEFDAWLQATVSQPEGGE